MDSWLFKAKNGNVKFYDVNHFDEHKYYYKIDNNKILKSEVEKYVVEHE